MQPILQLSFDWASHEHAFAWCDRATGTGETGVVSADPDRFHRWFSKQTQLMQKTQAVLGEYFPQALEIAGKENTKSFRAFLKRWPDLDSLRRSRPQTLRRFFIEHRIRHRASIESRLQAAAEATAVTTDEAIVTTAKMRLGGLLGQLEALADTIAQYDRTIAQFMRESIPAWENDLVRSFPCVGACTAPRLVVALEAAVAMEQADRASAFVGVAPVTKRSGKKTIVHRRYSRPVFLHQSLVEYANVSRRSCLWAQEYYRQRKQRGEKHWSIMRSLAYKWMRIFVKCWQNHQLYDEARHLENLRKQQSPYALKSA